MFFVRDEQALVVNAEVIEFRKRSLVRQQAAVILAGGEMERPESMRCSSATAAFAIQTLERGEFSSSSDKAAWSRERHDASLVEARALAVLRKRDRVRNLLYSFDANRKGIKENHVRIPRAKIVCTMQNTRLGQ